MIGFLRGTFSLSRSSSRTLILGTTCAWLWEGTTPPQPLDSPDDLQTLAPTSSLTILLDYQGPVTYHTLPFPRLSALERKAAIHHHPLLQDPSVLGATAQIKAGATPQTCRVNLATLSLDPRARGWIESLIQQGHHIASVAPLACYLSPPSTKAKCLYWITATPDQQWRHLCLQGEMIVFVRYTSPKNLEAEIQKTYAHIQRDFALSPTDIEIIQDDHQDHTLPSLLTGNKAPLSFYFPHRLPDGVQAVAQDLAQTYRSSKRWQQFHRLLTAGSIGALCVSLITFGTALFTQQKTQRLYDQNLAAFRTLPQDLQTLSNGQIAHAHWLVSNGPDPEGGFLSVLRTLHAQAPPFIRCEEIHWTRNLHTCSFNLSLFRTDALTAEDHRHWLHEIFPGPVHVKASDDVVDRFQISLPVQPQKVTDTIPPQIKEANS